LGHNGKFEGGYNTHHKDRYPIKALTFSGNTFVQHTPYVSILPLHPEDRSELSQDGEGFLNSMATLEGTFTVNEIKKRIILHYDDTANIRQKIHAIFSHPFVKEFPTDSYWTSLEDFDKMVWFFLQQSLEFSFEDSLDKLYPITASGDGRENVLYFKPLIREGLSLDILEDVGGDERLGHVALIGRWELDHEPWKGFEFHADGTVVFFSSSLRDDIYSQAGTWTLEGNQLTMSFANIKAWTGEWNVRISDDTLIIGRWFDLGGSTFYRAL